MPDRALVEDMFEVSLFFGDVGEHLVAGFVKLGDAKDYAKQASADWHAEYIVRGPNEPHGIVFLQATYRDGEEVKDCEHS